MLKVDLHIHTADDPVDRVTHSTAQLLQRAADLGFDALAVTLHDAQLDVEPYRAQAERYGIVLIAGIERTIEGKHVLLLNFSNAAERVRTFSDLARLRASEPSGLVIAPHPFFPGSSCLRSVLDTHASLFDAVEWNAMFSRRINFNTAADRWARAHGKPMVGNGDVHLLEQLGTTFSLVDAERDADAICAAIAAGRVEVVARPHSDFAAVSLFARLVVSTQLPRERRTRRVPVVLPATPS